MLGGWGFNLAVNAFGTELLTNGAASLHELFPMLKAYVYWNQNFDFKVRIDPRRAGDPRMPGICPLRRPPYFNSTSTALPTDRVDRICRRCP